MAISALSALYLRRYEVPHSVTRHEVWANKDSAFPTEKVASQGNAYAIPQAGQTPSKSIIHFHRLFA